MPWHSSPWTPERIDRLKYLWDKGFSAGLIAIELHTTRNAVIGKIGRLGLEWRKETQLRLSSRNSRSKPARMPRPIISSPSSVDGKIIVAPHRWVSLLDLRPRQCRWPHGDGPPFAFCGATVLEDFSYCPQHARAAYPGLRK